MPLLHNFAVRVGERELDCSLRVSQGRAQGRIFAIHGGGQTRRYFERGAVSAVDVFSSHGFEVVSFDRPGYGRNADWDIGFDAQAAALAAAVDAVQAECPTAEPLPLFLYGHSIGGMLSILMAIGQPGRFCGVAVVGSGPVYHEAAATRMRQRIATETGSHSVPAATGARARYVGPPGTFDKASAEYDPERDVPSLMTDLRNAMDWERRLPLEAARVTDPVQMTVPEFDELWRADAVPSAALAGWFSNSPLVDTHVQRLCGHSVMIHHAALPHLLRVSAFFGECRIRFDLAALKAM